MTGFKLESLVLFCFYIYLVHYKCIDFTVKSNRENHMIFTECKSSLELTI